MEIPEKIQKYANDHSLDLDLAKKELNITWNEDTIIIPIYGMDKKLLYCKYRHLTGDTKFTFDKGGHPALYCSHKIKNKDWLILGEGEIDATRLWQEGIPAVSGTSGVATFTKKLAEPLKGKTVYICLDTDEAGQNEVGKYINTLEAVEAIPMVITLPKESKDICEYFTAGGTKGTFTKLLDVALSAKEYKKLHQKEEYRIETMTEIVKEEMSEEGWLIDKILPIEGFVFIVGAEATGKSFYSLTMANSVTTGEKWLGEFEVIKQTKVLFIDKENTRRRTQKRIKGLNITEQATNKMFRLRYPEFFQLQKQESDMSSDGFSDFAHQASDLVKEEGIGMIVVDSFTDIMVGNENAAADTQAFFDAFRQLFPGVLFATLHHDNKAVQGVDLRTSGQRIRGSTNIPAQIVAGFRATPIPKTKNEFSFEQVKAGDSEKLDPFKIKLVVEDDPEDITKTIVARLEYGGKYFSEEGKIAQAKEAIIELFAKNPTMLREEIVSGAMTDNNGEFSPRTVTTALKQLVDHDLISKEQVGRKVQYLWVGDN